MTLLGVYRGHCSLESEMQHHDDDLIMIKYILCPFRIRPWATSREVRVQEDRCPAQMTEQLLAAEMYYKDGYLTGSRPAPVHLVQAHGGVRN